MQAREKLADAVPVLTADQAETVLGRLREADYAADDPLVVSLLARLGETGGVRRRNRAGKWFDAEASGREERRVQRQNAGTVAEQRQEYASYVEQLANRLEAATKGQVVTPRERELQARGRGMLVTDILTSNPATIRAKLSEEALRALGDEGPPLSFDAWRYANLGARDRRAVASWQRRTGSYFSEHG